MDAILGQTTDYGRRQKLRAMTEGLDLKDFYGATIERIKKQGGEKARLGMAALMWISHSERLLQLDEILHALAVEIGSTDLNAENVPSIETLLSCCLGLVVCDREASTIRLIHFSLQEYLNIAPDIFGPTHSLMAEICLTYLNFQTIKDILSIARDVRSERFILPQSTPFLKYSSLCWGIHARQEASKGVISLALQLFSQIEGHISTKLLLEDLKLKMPQSRRNIPADSPQTGFTGLHCVSIFGIVEIATSLMNQPNCNLNKQDILGITPLVWAAICGQEEVARLLLQQQTISPDKPDRHASRTALSWAARMGHEGIVRLLLEWASSKPDGTDGWWGKTPQLVKMVRGRYVNPNRLDVYGQTPLTLAAEAGHEGVVRLLLGRKDVNPDTPDNGGQTPLSWAAMKGHDGVVKLLLGQEGVKPNIQDSNGQTPLAWAAEQGHDRLVKLLLEREDINPNMPDNRGRTPLYWAVKEGNNKAVELLLEREDVNLNMPEDGGRTLLLWAAEEGNNKAVELLLKREDVNPNVQDNCGQTLLSQTLLSWDRESAEVVKLLLEREGFNPDISIYGRTPLFLAIIQGNDKVVELLLGREDVNPNIQDSGRTPLSWAAGQGYDRVVKILLEREDINPNMPDNDGRTPLLYAVEGGNNKAVELLLKREDVNLNMPENCGRTLLLWAIEKGHDGVVELLLGRDDVNLNMSDNRGRTPLS